ncbi:outer membrane protein assembly factor [Vineibacter terrae]|uniref:Outer membrane protein assembly factor n=1 Tax=Vineibacter terrae TaxID=2586908 RepID=A0A5C8PI36_9HYPH|nr:autotransporter assembly complex family protein [Vineibacter terrae]TXL73009.1 outer membrane protein assembly factor [Vineibacter terrae]
MQDRYSPLARLSVLSAALSRKFGSPAGAIALALAAATAGAQAPDATPPAAPAPATPGARGKAVVSLQFTGNEKLREELQKLVGADAEAQAAGATSITILQRAHAQRDLVIKALRAYGYYANRVTARAAGRDVDDPAAIDAIDALPAGADVPVEVAVESGPRFNVQSIDVVLPPAASGMLARDKLPLAVGQPAEAAKILSTDDEILNQLQRHGYALARIVKRDVLIDHDTRTARITWRIDPGPPATMGTVTFRGQQRTETEFLERRVPYQPGQPYHPDRIEDLRTRMTELGIFSSVNIIRGNALDADGHLPVVVEVTERPPRTIGFSASYASSEGAALRAYWQHRNLTGEADSLRLSAGATGLVEHSLADTGFAITADYRKPDFLRIDQAMTLQAAVIREINDAYRRQSAMIGGGIERLINKGFVVRAGIAFETEVVETAERRATYLPLSLPMGMTLDRANSPLDPTRGYRLALDVIPYFDLRNPGHPFVKLRATGSTYLDLTGSGSTVVALRASVGVMPGATKDAVPPDKRFYAGGGGSVRGFDYQSAGPRDADHRPLGGQSLIEGSVELRQRLTEKFGAVVFVDAGTTYSSSLPGKGDPPRIGAGVGVRYYSDFGPIRADVATPINRRPGDSWYGLYISIGQAF